MNENRFDEKAQSALRLLFERFWILRAEDPASYQLIREREKVLKRYIDDKFGYDLIIHQHFIKLEKIPVEPKSWMGIQAFTMPLDYAIFCCALAFSENRAVDEQFLLSDLCGDIKELYPGGLPLDWTNYNHRKSLVRVVRQLEMLSLIRAVEGEVEQFALDVEQEVLYEVTVYARYFMRAYPKDIFEFTSIEEMLASEEERHTDDLRRKRVYRKLFLSPAVFRVGEEDSDFAYIRNFRNRLRDDIETHSHFRLELFKNMGLLIMDEKKQEMTLFPDQKAISDLALQFSALLRNQMDTYPADAFGRIQISAFAMEHLVEQLQAEYGTGWSSHYRKNSVKATTEELIDLLLSWEMIEVEPETNDYLITPLAGRLAGVYPSDFKLKGEEVDA
ncbi:hypothetical protein OXB_1727 [Bacillus sp. OxB-1]|uniref:TIGR02678 family protein n=1 Tax=Bacillus sp. (strain OxB-1) TaxID=98228 RepID=UPI0005822FE1|nr:TIGR02678 family protein [Bacillus sp. OxB-1]BAQ10198.1 hypothetical protein OXB_1727 [Bacillus sp. OxB-1]